MGRPRDLRLGAVAPGVDDTWSGMNGMSAIGTTTFAGQWSCLSFNGCLNGHILHNRRVLRKRPVRMNDAPYVADQAVHFGRIPLRQEFLATRFVGDEVPQVVAQHREIAAANLWRSMILIPARKVGGALRRSSEFRVPSSESGPRAQPSELGTRNSEL